ncbi:hypothetical protein FKM82_028147 [Ascaphus truei]
MRDKVPDERPIWDQKRVPPALGCPSTGLIACTEYLCARGDLHFIEFACVVLYKRDSPRRKLFPRTLELLVCFQTHSLCSLSLRLKSHCTHT